MHSKLAEIIRKTKEDLVKRKEQVGLDTLKKLVGNIKTRTFINAMTNPHFGSMAIIAEVKFASPTEGFLGSHQQLLSRAQEYEKAGADAISIVTEKHFFQGDPQFVSQIKQITTLPVLQKDFILDEYQIYEVAKNRADAVLLIAKFLSEEQLVQFVEITQSLGLEPVVEINDELDLKKAIATNTKIIAVNARDLTSFVVDVDRACQLIKKIPQRFVKLGFSGISTRVEVDKYKQAEVNGVLIGTSLMKAGNIIKYLLSLRATEGSVAI